MRIFIDEEYGWRYWCWDYPGTADELRADWEAGRIPPGLGYVGRTPGFRGTATEIEPMKSYWDRLEAETKGDEEWDLDEEKFDEAIGALGKEWDKFLSEYDAQMDIHEEDDSSLRIGDLTVPWMLVRDDETTVRERLVNPLPKEQS
jgi:hypothetical protein